MKTLHTLLSVVATILTVECGRPNSLVLLCGEEQPGSAVARQYTVSLEKLAEASPQQRAQFFEERGARACWAELQRLERIGNREHLSLEFRLESLKQRSVVDEVMAGVIRYLAHHYPRQVNALTIVGSTGADFNHNHITSLDPAIGKLTNLTELFLCYNQLQALPEAIGNLTKLTTLYLDHNQLQALPTDIGKLTNLTILQVANNQLKALPEAIGDLTKLTALWIFNNQLQALPTDIGKLINLETLYLDHNQLQALSEAIGNLTKLTMLNVANNQLKALPKAIGDLTKLITLQLEHNQLKALPKAIGDLTKLITLQLEHNQLQALPEAIGNLTKLTTLQLEHNQLKALPEAIGNLTNATLQLANNQLPCLSDSLHPWLQQSRLTTSENPWLQPADLILIPETIESLVAKVNQTLLYLRTLCILAIDPIKLTKEQKELISKQNEQLPPLGFLEDRRKESWKKYPWISGIVFFDQRIPFYVAERQLRTPTDGNKLLKDLKNKQLYYLPEAGETTRRRQALSKACTQGGS